VAAETPIRQAEFEKRGSGFYFREGLPDMRAWKPEDFLPEEYLDTPQTHICELPREDYDKLRPLQHNISADKTFLEDTLHYARQGVTQAQAAMGWYCQRSSSPEEKGITAEEAMTWVQRAAATGDSNGMAMIGRCLHHIRWRDEGRRDDFRVDEELYWFWRAAEKLNSPALLHLTLAIGRENFSYKEIGGNFKHEYMWLRLMKLSHVFENADPWVIATLGGAEKLREDYNFYKSEGSENWITKEHESEAEAMTGEWLRARPEVFVELNDSMRCPGEEDFANYDGANKSLAPLNLHLVPPGHLREGPAPDIE
jgi:hypothetical protein